MPDSEHAAWDTKIYPVAMRAPAGSVATEYDRSHLITYARLLDASDSGADWREAAVAILGCDIARDPEGAEKCWNSHLERAHWVITEGLARFVATDS